MKSNTYLPCRALEHTLHSHVVHSLVHVSCNAPDLEQDVLPVQALCHGKIAPPLLLHTLSQHLLPSFAKYQVCMFLFPDHVHHCHGQKGNGPKESLLVLKPHGPMGAMPHVFHGVSLTWSKGALRRLLGVSGRHWKCKVVMGSQKELSVSESVSESVREHMVHRAAYAAKKLAVT